MNYIYVVALRRDRKLERKNFYNKQDALDYWEKMGKEEYTYWQELIF